MSHVVSGKNISLRTPAVQQEWFSYVNKRDELQSKIAQTKIGYDRNKGLYEKGVISRAEFEKYSFDYTYAQQALSGLEKNQRSMWQNNKRDLEIQLKNLNGTLQKIKVESQNYYITAPMTASDMLIVESSVSPNDIGLIQKNQKVKFQLDAFNYNQWGLLEGKVIDIDRNITIQGDQVFFKVRSALNTTSMNLQSGYKTKVSKGMTLTTRYMITRRSLFDLLFDKVDDWLNPKNLNK